MRLPLLLSLVLVTGCSENRSPVVAETQAASAPQAPASAGEVQVDPRHARSIADVLSAAELNAREQDELDDASLIASRTAIRWVARWVPGYPGLLEFTLRNTGTVWLEKFLLQVPPTAPSSPVPLLVVFHKYGASHGDVLNTTFLAETQARGWYCLSPLGARQKHFGDLVSQINTRAALELVAELFPIDQARVYGVGFSMGGGAAANYAARHQDPGGIRFAALCDHTGGVSLAHTWNWEVSEVQGVLEGLYGGTPVQQPFAYERCSSIDLDPFNATIGAGTDFARNLSHVPTLVWVAASDPMAYLVTQTNAFFGHIQPQNGADQLDVAPGNVHAWGTLDCHYVCDWLQQFTLQDPTAASTLADEDGVWFHFQVEQDAGGAFTPFRWSVDAALRRFVLSSTRNLKRLTVDAAPLGIAPPGQVTLRLATADGTGDRVRLLGASAAPTSVLRDGVAASGTWDGLTQSFEIAETDGALHEWVLTFP